MACKTDILNKISELQSSLDTKLQNTTKTKILFEIDQTIGTLSNPSKMPGHAWSISTQHCQTGRKLADIPGTPCSLCYAQKGRYNLPNVKAAMDLRFRSWIWDSDWSKLMAIRLLLLEEPYFRWFDSGDIWNMRMLEDINQVALDTVLTTQHWLPTQERDMVATLGGAVAPNLTIRISSTKIDSEQHTKIPGALSSSVMKNKKTNEYVCPSHDQGNKCGSCRACWDKNISHIVYRIH